MYTNSYFQTVRWIIYIFFAFCVHSVRSIVNNYGFKYVTNNYGFLSFCTFHDTALYRTEGINEIALVVMEV